MHLDKQTMFSEDQAVTVTAPSTNVLDLGALAKTGYGQIQLTHKVGAGKIPLLIQVVEAFATLTSLKIAIESDDASNFPSPKELISDTVPVAELAAGYVSHIRELPIIKERYIRIKFTVNGADATAGKITAGIATSVDDTKY